MDFVSKYSDNLKKVLENIEQKFYKYFINLFESVEYKIDTIKKSKDKHGQGGVYAFFHPINKELLYIGKTGGIGTRMTEHHGDKKGELHKIIDKTIKRKPELGAKLLPLKDNLGGIFVKYVIINEEWERIALEKILIDLLHPILNE